MSWVHRLRQVLFAPKRDKVAGGPGVQTQATLHVGSRDAESYLQEGWFRLRQKDPAGALGAFTNAIELKPTGQAFYARGVANCTFNRYREALADLNSALELEPRFPAALTERGLAYVESGDIDRGLEDYTTALSIDLSYGFAHTNKGSALCLQKRWSEAIPFLDIGLRLNPGNIEGLFNRSAAHEMLGDFLRAQADLEACVKSGAADSEIPGARDRLARLNAVVGPRAVPPWSISEEIWTEFVILEGRQTVADLVASVEQVGAFFVVLESAEGNRAVAAVYGYTGLRQRLTEIADVIGESILSLRLEQFHDLWPLCAPVEPGVDRELAVRRAQESGGHTIVLEGERTRGVFSCGFAYHLSLTPTAIFCSEPAFGRRGRVKWQRQCSVCTAALAYFEAIIRDGMLDDCACPECKASPVPYWIEARMRPGRWSRDGFLGDQESLAEVITGDGGALERLGLSHGQVAAALERLLDAASTAYADRIAEAIESFEAQMRSAGQRGVAEEAVLQLRPSLDEVENQILRHELPDPESGFVIDEYQVFLQVFLGYQHCPWTILNRPWSNEEPAIPISIRFSADVVYRTARPGCDLPCRQGLDYRHADRNFLIINRNTGEHIRGSGLMVHLIRDHCFFEGARSPYRLEPEHTARVLGLL